MVSKKQQKQVQQTHPVNLLRLFSLCFLAVGALFVIYEVVERTWLRGVDPQLLYTLHLLRGLAAAAIAAALVTILLTRSIHDPAVRKFPSSGVTQPWKRRLQHVSLRTKIVVPMLVLAVVPAIAVAIITITRMQQSLRESAFQGVAFETASKARRVDEFLKEVQQDLIFLSRLNVVRNLADAEVQGVPSGIDILREEAEEQLLVFSQGKRAYYQIRYLDGEGQEVVRLNVEKGRPETIPVGELQNKSERYYVKEAFKAAPGKIYVSPMDLNVEYGQVEVPHRAVVRYATAVLASGGGQRGLLVINLSADYLFSLIGTVPAGTEGWLVDQEGTYLGYVGGSPEKRAIYDLEKKRHLSADYGSDEVASVLKSQGTFETKEALYSFAPILFDVNGLSRRWILIISQPRAPIDAPILQLTVFLSVGVVLVLAVAGVLGILVAHYLARPVAVLRRATREIASGDLSKQVEIITGDEIEGLAVDFNAMTERLREAQERLSAWNVELEREVKRQTDQLHRLQSGLAQADKLASVGQMTAGVMHEIGNPLAAIKTKIQVAEEEDDNLPGDCRLLLSEVLSEVDRLTTFLRSFSRLARLRKPEMEEVSPQEVVQGVKALVAPELQRRGISLCVESESDVPSICGDPNQLRQLLINLILNAEEASPDGKEIVARVYHTNSGNGTSKTARTVCIEIMDQGTGMPADIIDKMWDPFFTTKADGTGLGLAICRQIVEDHSGTIQIQSEPNNGTIVTLTFPTLDEQPGQSK